MPGQLYGLAGLYLVAPPTFQASHQAYLLSDGEVQTFFGCITAPVKVSTVVEDIVNGELPRRFRRGEPYEPFHWWVGRAQSGAN